MTSSFCVFLFLGCGIASVSSCRPDWVQFEESCYGFGELKVTWEEAADICMSAGAKLAEVETSAENEFLKSEARVKGGYFWLGASDIFHEGSWTWMSTGALLYPFSDWAPDKPNNANDQDCLRLHQGYNYQWDDGSCSRDPHQFICETGPDEVVVG